MTRCGPVNLRLISRSRRTNTGRGLGTIEDIDIPTSKQTVYLLLFVCSTGLFQEQKEWLVSFLLLFGRSSYIGRMFGRKQVMRLYAEAECKVKSRKKVNCIAQTPGSESMLSAPKANYFVDLRHWNYDPCGRTTHPVGLLVSISLLKKFLRTSPN